MANHNADKDDQDCDMVNDGDLDGTGPRAENTLPQVCESLGADDLDIEMEGDETIESVKGMSSSK